MLDPSNPLDIEIPLWMTELWVDRNLHGSTPAAKSAMKALIHAQTNPKALVKVTCRTVDEIDAVVRILSIITDSDGSIDMTKLHSKDPDGWPILELKNGSGIIIAKE